VGTVETCQLDTHTSAQARPFSFIIFRGCVVGTEKVVTLDVLSSPVKECWRLCSGGMVQKGTRSHHKHQGTKPLSLSSQVDAKMNEIK